MPRHPLTSTAPVLLLALLLVGQAMAQQAPATTADLPMTRASRFLPPTTQDAYFSDWSRIVADTRSVYPIPPRPGDDDFIRALAGRHGSATQLAIGGGRPWWVHEQWGWSVLDLDWELQIGSNGAVLAFRDGFDPAPLLGLLDERGFERGDHHAQATWHHAFDPSLPWLRPPLAAFQNLAYLEDERVLLLATGAEALQAMLDAHAGRSASWPGAAVMEAFGDAAEQPMSAMVFSASPVCGMAPQQEVQAQAFEAVALTYHRQDEALLGSIVIGYADEVTAGLDQEARARLVDEGRDRSEALYSERHFRLLGTEVAGNVLWLHLGSLAAPSRLFDLLLRGDAGFLACPAADG